MSGTRAKLMLLVGLVWLVYASSLRNPFVFDDQHVITQNPAVRSPAAIPSYFVDATTFSILPGNRDYRPVFLTSMALCWWSGRGSTLPFHLVSVALHTANVLLLFLLFRRIAPGEPSAGSSEGDTAWAAFLAAGLYAIHPLATEPVNYISSQSVLLAAFFYLSAFYLFLTVYSGPSAAPRLVRLAGSYASYALALLSKPIAVTFPVMLLLWEFLLGGEGSRAAGGGGSFRSRYGRLLKHVPYLGLTLGYLALRTLVMPTAVGQGMLAKLPLATALAHVATQTRALVFYYLKLAFLPAGLNVDRELARSVSLVDGAFFLSLVILAGIAGLLFRRRRDRVAVFWSLWFPVCLFVTTYGMALGQIVREARAYLALAGFCAVVGLVFSRLWRSFPLEISDASLGKRSGRFLTISVLALIAFFFGVMTTTRNRVWSSELRLWENAARHGGTWRAHMSYGSLLEGQGRREEAMVELREAFEREANAFTHVNLGLAYVKRGDVDDGLAYLEAAAWRWPEIPETHLHLAYGLDKSGKPDEAESELKKAVDLRPNYLLGYQKLAELYQRQGKLAEATASYRRLLDLDPAQAWARERIRILEQGKEPPAIFREAFSRQREGKRGEAIELYLNLLRLDPEHRQGNFNLAYAYLQGSSPKEWSRSAILFERLLAIDPDYTEVLFHLASACWKLERKAEAVRYDRRYVQLPGAHRDLRKQAIARLARAGVE